MPINKNELTKEMVEKALNVKDAKELMALAEKCSGWRRYVLEKFQI